MPTDELPDGLVENWYEYWRLASGSRAQRETLEQGRPAHVRFAHDFVDGRVDAGGQEAVDLLVLLAEAAPPGDDGLTVGAGPLEDLLDVRDRTLLELVAVAARRSPAFGRAVSHAVMPPDL